MMAGSGAIGMVRDCISLYADTQKSGFYLIGLLFCLQCFDAVGWVAGRASGLWKTERWDAGMVMCLGRGADLHMAQLMPLPLTISCSSKSWLVRLPPGFAFLVLAHLGSPGQSPEGRKMVVIVVVVIQGGPGPLRRTLLGIIGWILYRPDVFLVDNQQCHSTERNWQHWFHLVNVVH